MSNFLSEELVERVYFGMIQALMEDLRTGGRSIWPDVGTFKLKTLKGKWIAHSVTKEKLWREPCDVVDFEPCAKMKYYVKNRLKN
jgi:nucleoid DNA-binding protein